MAKAIEAKFLVGLMIAVLVEKKIKGEKGDEVRKVPVERELTPDDVLDWKDKGDAIVIVAADGQKHVVSKRAGAPEDPDGDKDKDPGGKGQSPDGGKGKDTGKKAK